MHMYKLECDALPSLMHLVVTFQSHHVPKDYCSNSRRSHPFLYTVVNVPLRRRLKRFPHAHRAPPRTTFMHASSQSAACAEATQEPLTPHRPQLIQTKPCGGPKGC